ncbi:collagen alpha-1(VI) chain-like [Osmerus mordax]|uniref:collagen alpha-1(VI) chain-like n=1 Tax=Osmerus mordax TaxID=8014 RepID=UPI00350EC261
MPLLCSLVLPALLGSLLVTPASAVCHPGGQGQAAHRDCPADVSIVLDTSESVALRDKPYGSLVEQIKQFAMNLVDQLDTRYYRCNRNLEWNVGVLHYSDEVKVMSELTSTSETVGKARIKTAIQDIRYIGKGTHTDCAISVATGQLMRGSPLRGNKFMVVVTDGHPLDGWKEPCGGLAHAVAEARVMDVHIFAVPITPHHLDNRLGSIATEMQPTQNFSATGEDPQVVRDTISFILASMYKQSEDLCCTFECKASEGPQGPLGDGGEVGTPGRHGISGKPGSLGAKGTAGDNGPPGHRGEKGDQGRPGDRGPRGLAGQKGEGGVTGVDGKDGFGGDPGAVGLPGCKGDEGAVGTAGLPGQKGDAGSHGLQGPKGEPGSPGDPGSLGVVGPSGVKGETGPKGAPGSRGDRGEDGDYGPPGTPGGQGEKGERGPIGPTGVRGAPGEKAEPGPPGAQGHEGQSGAIGSQGTSGVEGQKGYKGEAGNPGPAGVKGPRGSPGPTGVMGPMGERGEDGPPGDGQPGNAGIQGHPGLRGQTGVKGIRGLPGIKGDAGQSGDPGDDNGQPGPGGPPGPKGYPGFEGENGVPGPVGHAGLDECEIMEVIQKLCTCCVCECGPVKLLFVLDSSESVGLQNFTLEKEFIIRVINKMGTFSSEKNEPSSRVGVVQYSHEGTQELVSMGDPTITSITHLKSAVKNMRWIAGGTYTGEALEFALKALAGSQLSRGAVVVLTDGRSDTRDTKPLSSLCSIPNIKVVGVGIGDIFRRAAYTTMLEEITCLATPNPGLLLKITDHAQLLEEQFLSIVTDAICHDKKCPDYHCPAEFKQATDIVFMLDGSSSVGRANFQETREFVEMAAITMLLNDAEGQLRISVLQYSDSRRQRLEVPFTTRTGDVEAGLTATRFMDGATNLPAALAFLASTLQKDGRPGVARKVVLFTDGRSAGATSATIANAAATALGQGIRLLAFTVGKDYDEAGVCQLVTGQLDGFDYNVVDRRVLQVALYRDLARPAVVQRLVRKLTKV